MKILHVTQCTGAGVPRHVAALSSFQSQRGASVAVAGAPSLHSILATEHFIWSAHSDPAVRPRERRELERIMAAYAPDIVHLHSTKAGLVGRLVVRGRRPTVFTPHGWAFLRDSWSRSGARLWERWAARWTSLLVAVSADEASAASSFPWAVPPVVVPNGVDVARWTPVDDQERVEARRRLGLDPDAPLAVCVGRLTRQKGQIDLARGWNQVRARVPRATLALVGDGEDRSSITAAAGEAVHVVGETSDVQCWYDAADVAVQPSHWEGMSYATIEAMASGLPVVAFGVGGMRQALGAGDHLLAPADYDGLVRRVADLLSDRERRRDIGHRNRARAVALFDEKPLLEEIDRAVRSLV